MITVDTEVEMENLQTALRLAATSQHFLANHYRSKIIYNGRTSIAMMEKYEESARGFEAMIVQIEMM